MNEKLEMFLHEIVRLDTELAQRLIALRRLQDNAGTALGRLAVDHMPPTDVAARAAYDGIEVRQRAYHGIACGMMLDKLIAAELLSNTPDKS